MAHFRATIKGQRGETSRLGSKNSGITARVNGWHSGVTVIGGDTMNGDRFDLYATAGSDGRFSDVYIGFVKHGVFHPETDAKFAMDA